MPRVLAVFLLLWLAGCGGPGGEGVRPENPVESLLGELARELNPQVEGLQPFFAFWEAGEVPAAKEALLTYFRAKAVPPEALPDPLPVDQSILIRGLDAWRGTFSFQGRTAQAAEKDGPIDWTHRGPDSSAEWSWFLHRHAFLRDMLLLYEVQGHDEFAGRMRDYLVDWFWKFPPPEKQSFSAAWRALEAARRYVDSWLPVYAGLRGNPAFGEEAELAILAGAARHADYLRHHHHFGGNHLVTEMMSLASIAAVFPEFTNARDWLDYAVSRSLEEMERQVYPDGAHKELANHYQWIAGSSFQRLYALLVATGNPDAASRLRPGMEKIWDYYAWVTRPNGTGPLNNDSDLEPNAEQLRRLARFYDREDWLFVATGGSEGQRPAGGPSRVFPWAGHVVLRTDWGAQGDWVFFDAGAFGSDHQQQDRLHLSVSLMGKNLLVDSGRYVYRDDEWAEYFRGPRAHNVPTFDRYERIIPDPVAAKPQDALADLSGDLLRASGNIPLRDPATGVWSGQHSRQVALGDGFLWVVDQVDLARPDSGTFRWHFHPDLDLVETDEGWLIRQGDRAVARWIAVSTVDWEITEIRGRDKGGVQGWYSPEYNERLPNSVLTYRTQPTSRSTTSWLLASADSGIESAELRLTETEAKLILRIDGDEVIYSLDRDGGEG